MTYRSILVHACESASAQARYRLAAIIARSEGAHLGGIAASGATQFMYLGAAAAAAAAVGPEDCAFLTEAAQRDLAAFEETVRAMGVSSVDCQLTDDTPESALPLAGRYCDLLLVGQAHSPAAVVADNRSLARAVVVHSPCPVLVVPANLSIIALPARPLLAWDGSMEASRAVRAALPLLRHAASVTAVRFHPQKYRADGDEDSRRLRAYLACHRIEVDIIEPSHASNVGQALLSMAEARSNDLIVMGSFGHSRFREIMLGGASETVLAEAAVPILMSH